MRKDSRFRKFLVILSAMTLIMAGCGASSSDSAFSEAKTVEAPAAAYGYDSYNDVYDYAESAEEAVYEENGTSEEVTVNDTSRKLIRNVDMRAETENLDELIANLNSRINQYGGYVEYSYIENGSTYGNYRSSRSASYTIRIPAEHLDAFLANVSEFSNIVSKNINVTDVTLQYVDVEARKSSLATEQQRLLELMEKAETVEDIITIEERLSEIRYELESAERQLRTYDNQVDYSTVTINIDEVKKYTPVEETSRLEKIKTGFVTSVSDVFEGILDFGTGFIIALPFIIVWAIVILIIVLIIRGIVKYSKKKAIKKKQKAMMAQNSVQAPPAQQMQNAQAQTVQQTTQIQQSQAQTTSAQASASETQASQAQASASETQASQTQASQTAGQ